jgi:methionine-S-sulfoxide reductase
VGYAGGTKENPTYRSLGDHTEVVQIDYDPSLISYGELLAVFWESHDPGGSTWSRQYMNAVFYHDEEQMRTAERTRDALEKRTGRDVKTKVLPYTGFTRAEDYHQKHALRLYHGLMEELGAIYPSIGDFVDSTAVTRVNGYAGGYGKCEDLKKEAWRLGLSPEGIDSLSLIVCGRKGVVPSCPVPE